MFLNKRRHDNFSVHHPSSIADSSVQHNTETMTIDCAVAPNFSIRNIGLNLTQFWLNSIAGGWIQQKYPSVI